MTKRIGVNDMPSDTFTPPALDTKEESGSFSPPPLNSKRFVPPPVESKTGLAPISYNHPEETIQASSRWRNIKNHIEYALEGVFPGMREKGSPSPASVTSQSLMIMPLGLPERLGKLLMSYFAGSTAYQQPAVYRQIKEEIKSGDYTSAQRTAIEDFLNVGIVGTGVAATFGKKSVEPIEQKVPPILQKTAPATAEALKTTLKQGGKSAGDIASATGVPEPKIRPSVGEATPLRQPGEAAPAQPPLQQGTETAPVTPAIQTTSGEVVTGKDHVAAYEKAKETVQPDTSGSREGFVDNATGKFITREEAAEKTGLPTKTEPGKLHSSDLPPSEPAKSVPSVTKKNTQQTDSPETSSDPSGATASPLGGAIETKTPAEQAKSKAASEETARNLAASLKKTSEAPIEKPAEAKTMGKAVNPLVEQIVKVVGDQQRRMFVVVERRGTLGSDGKEYGLGMPLGVKAVGHTKPYYVFQSVREGTTIGRRYNTREEAEAALEASAKQHEDEMRKAIENKSPEEIQSQADYWLKEKAPQPQAKTTSPQPDSLKPEWKRQLKQKQAIKYKTASDEKTIERLKAKIANDPSKWSIGDGVGYRVNSGRGTQVNRGFRIIAVDPKSETVTVRQVADTGLTSSGGDYDQMRDAAIDMIDLVRDKKYNATPPTPKSEPVAAVEKVAEQAQQSPVEVLNSSDKVKVSVPKGATMLRVHTESSGKKFAPKVISKSELEKGNIFKGSGVSKIEAGTMSGKEFIPMKGKVSIEANPEKVMKAGPGAATKSPIDVESDIGRNVTNIPPLQKLADAVKDFPQQRGGGFRESLRQWKESVGIPFKDTFANALTNVKAQTARLVKSITALPEVTDIERRVGVWDANDQEGSMVAQNFSKEIRRQFKDRSKLRALANYIDAQGDMGLLQERADATKDPKLKKTYEDALDFGDAEKRFAAEIQQYHDEMLSIAQEHGALEEGVDNYIHRIYREKDPMLEKQKANLQYLRFTKNFNGFKKRFYATDFEAEQAGLKPEKDIAKRILAYDQGFRRALTARAFVKASFEATMPDGRPELDVVGMGVKVGEPSDPKAILIKPKWRQNSDDPIDFRGDYVPFDHPAFQRWKFATKDEAGKPILVEGQILVHPNAAKKYAALFDKSWWQKTPVRRGVLKTSQVVKQTMLSISGFHPVQIAVHALEHRVNPFKIVDLVPHDPKQRELMEGGLTVADVKGEQIFSEGVYGTGLTEKIPILGEKMALTRDWLFKDFIPRVKMTMALKALDRKMENRSQDLASGKVTREQLVRQTARESNAAFGEQNYRALFRHPTFQDWLRFGFLAPDFGEARIRFPLQALTRHGTEQRNALILGAVGMAVIAKIVEHELTGQTRMDRPFTVTYKGHEYGLRNVASDLYKLVTEPNAYIRNRLNPIYTRAIMEFVTGRDAFGRTRTKAQQLLDEAKTIIPISARGLVTKNQQWWESFMNAMGMTERQRTSFSDIMKKVNDWKAAKGYESPAEFVYDPDKDPYSDLTHELVLGSDQRATREINRLVQGKTPAEQFKVYDHFKRSLYQRRYLTGSKEHEKEFVDSLSPGDKKLYNEAKQERSEMWQRFVRAWNKRDSNLLSTKDNADWEELMKEAEQ